MIPLQRIRDEPDAVREGARLKGEESHVDAILRLDRRARGLRTAVERTRAEQRAAGRAIEGKPTDEQRAELTAVKRRIQEGEAELSRLEAELQGLLLLVPNPPHESVPRGTDESGNLVVRTWGDRSALRSPLPHYELGERLGIFDFERAAKLSGSRFAVLRGAGPRLQRALVLLMLDLATARNRYAEVYPPYLVRREAMVGTGNLPKFEDDAFHADDGLFLIPTAEVPLTNLHREEILEATQLPIRLVAHTPCFRREAGSAGRDTRGFVRLHQFEKVELVKLVEPARGLDELESLVADAEGVLQALGIHYRVLLMCTGDMGFAQWKKYDIEAWCPGLGRYLEVSSCSAFGEFQARRASIRYRPAPGERARFVHTLNGSALALARTFDAVLETFQRPDGSVLVPDALRPYMAGTEVISPP